MSLRLRCVSNLVSKGLQGLNAHEALCCGASARSIAQPARSDAVEQPTGFSGIRISRILQDKAKSNAPSATLYWCRPEDTVYSAIEKMANANVGSILVMTGDSAASGQASKEEVAGVITERDYMRKVVVKGKSSKQMLCGQLMTGVSELSTLHPEDRLAKAVSVMEEKNIRHIPVMDQKRLVGMLSVKDIITTISNEHDAEVDSMSSYIGGNTY